MFAYVFAIALASSSQSMPACKAGELDDDHYFTVADIERFPAVGSNEVDFPSSKRIKQQGGVVYVISVDRCSKQIYSLIKYKGNTAVYGYYYRYGKNGELEGLDLRYIDGRPTAQEVIDRS